MEKQVELAIHKIRKEFCSKSRMHYRKKNENQAIMILNSNLGNLSNEHIGELLSIIDADIYDGKVVNRRFGLMLWGRNYDLILENDNQLLNRLFVEIYEKERIDVGEHLISQLIGVGDGLVSCLLYLKNREKYNFFVKSTLNGVKTLFPQEQDFTGSFEKRYLRFNELANRIKKKYDLAPQEVDIVLAVFPSYFRREDNVQEIDRLLDQLFYESKNDEMMSEIVIELVRWSQKDIDSVVEKAVKRIELEKFVGNNWSTLAFSILNSLGWSEKAGEILKALVDYDSDNGAFLNNYGIFLQQRGRLGEAIKFYARAYGTDYKAHGHEKATTFPAWRNLDTLTNIIDQKKKNESKERV